MNSRRLGAGFAAAVTIAAGALGFKPADAAERKVVVEPTSIAHCVDAKSSKYVDLRSTANGNFLGRAERPAPGESSPVYDPVTEKSLKMDLRLEDGYAIVSNRKFGVETKYTCVSKPMGPTQ